MRAHLDYAQGVRAMSMIFLCVPPVPRLTHFDARAFSVSMAAIEAASRQWIQARGALQSENVTGCGNPAVERAA